MNAMNSSYSLTRTDVVCSRSLRLVLATGALTLLLALGAVARIPLPYTPVPFTLQVFFLIYGALALGKKSLISVGSYLGLGAVGFPIFAGYAGGMAALFGPTGGYLFGFMISAFILANTIPVFARPRVSRDALFLALGMLAFYIPGVLWLKIITGLELKAAFAAGFLPFIIGDLFKVGFAYLLYRSSRGRLSQIL